MQCINWLGGDDLCEIMENCPADKRSAKDWYRLARSTTERLAEQGDGEAMYMLALLGGFPWLERSANAGYPEAEYRLAIMYKDGDKFYFPPWRRGEKIEALFKHAGESGHRIAMDYYLDILEKRGDIDSVRRIIVDLASQEMLTLWVRMRPMLPIRQTRWGLRWIL